LVNMGPMFSQQTNGKEGHVGECTISAGLR